MSSFPPPPPPSAANPPPPPAAPPFTTTISTLTSLLSLSTTTPSSPLLPLPPSTTTLLPCPFNHHHILPPSSLFSHHLRCPSSPSPLDPTSLLSSLHYPHTLNPPNPTPISVISNSETHLTLSIQESSHFSHNFFYLNCPAPVTFPPQMGPHQNLILPHFLSSHCTGFIDSSLNSSLDSSLDDRYASGSCIRLLASEIWAIKSEIERWNDVPEDYSYCVARGVLCLGMWGMEDFGIWVVANSPRFGVVVDLDMAGHIVLLVRLCLKAVVREAFGVVNDESKEKGWSGKRFCCPVLSRGLMWLGSQLGILYGEVNGKGFAISMVKQCLSDSSWRSCLFSAKSGVNQSEGLEVVGVDCEKLGTVRTEDVGKGPAGGEIFSSAVFVSQVVAAVAALHERQMLEAKIRALWDTRPLSTYQRILEHRSICQAADIERSKRPNYRHLIEHDGLFRQQSHGQDSNKAKTREEILAEERDYKRRRISYRGKKAMRSTTEVMRYIIGEHMEELKHAREMECSVKTVEDKQNLESITYTGHDSSTNIYQQSESLEFSSKRERGQQHNYRELSGSHSKAVTESSSEFLDNENHRRKTNRHLHQESGRTTTIDRTYREQYTRPPVDQRRRHHEEDHSVSPRQRRSKYERRGFSRSPDQQRRKYKRDDISSSPDGSTSKRYKKNSPRSPDMKLSSHHRHSDELIQDGKLISGISSHVLEKSYRKTSERHSHHREDRGHKLEVRNKSRGKTHQHHKSNSESYDRYDGRVEYNKIEDRYDPSESYGA